LLEAARVAAQEASAELKRGFGTAMEQRSKSGLHNLVTEYDERCERLIIDRLRTAFPDSGFLGEEGGGSNEGASLQWVIDPLDGTVNFAHGIPHFCVSVACWSHGRPVAGAIVDPMVGETFSFEWVDENDRAAFHEGQRLRLGDGGSPHQSLVYIGGGGPALVPLLRRFRSWRRMGSAALALAWVGSGRCGAYVQPGMLHPWDWAVGAPFVLAAGGVITDGAGAPWLARLSGTTGIIAAPRGIHTDIVDLAAAASARA